MLNNINGLTIYGKHGKNSFYRRLFNEINALFYGKHVTPFTGGYIYYPPLMLIKGRQYRDRDLHSFGIMCYYMDGPQKGNNAGIRNMPKVGEQIEKGGRRLQPQQQKFLDNYIHKDMTQTGAARAAGYKSPNVRAVQLLKNPVVRERMEEMRTELESKYGVTITKSVRDMQRLRDEAWSEGNYSAAIKAEELRLKVTGLMVARSHVTHENIETMSRDEIAEQLQEIMGRAKERMKDITPEQNMIEIEDGDITYDNGEAVK